MNEAVISLGSNIDPENNMALALSFIKKGLKVFSTSSIIRTAPIGNPDQPAFLNCAVYVDTPLDRAGLKKYLHKIEREDLKRADAQDGKSPRTIDLDLVIWNGEIIHRDYHEREFLRKLIAEIYPPKIKFFSK